MSSPHLARGVAGKGSALEARLVRRIGAGDSRALLVLYRRYSGMLRALTRRVLDDSSDAEEVLQEVFLQVWNEAGCYNPDRYSVSTWLVLITRRRAIDRLRSRCGGERAVTATQREGPVRSTFREVMGNVFMLARRARIVRERRG